MKKHRLILIVISIVLIVFLYFLPRIVVENEQDNEVSVAVGDEASEAVMPDNERMAGEAHQIEIPESEMQRINRMRSAIGPENSGQAAMADSLAAVFLSYQKYDSAAKYLAMAAGIDPGMMTYEKAGNAYFEALGFAMDREKADFLRERAQYYYGLILEEDPNRLDIKNNMAMTYISSSNPMAGITMLREILQEDPENETALFNMGILAIQSRQFERAGERFKNLVSLYPQNLQAQFYLGLCYYEMGEQDKARGQFELVKSMEDDPAVLATIEGYLKELN